jgi:phospholipid/cholesterol/gamma-HCH transport system ATP-binding protein
MQNLLKTKIEIFGLYKAFEGKKVLENLNMKVYSGRSFVILGRSGTGKSVLIKTVIGLITPEKGVIKIDGVELSSIKDKNYEMLKKCGFLFQSGALFDSMSVWENVTFFASKLHKHDTKALKDLAVHKLESVGLSSMILESFPSQLSGGMQKRVALARAICMDPEIIFFDEPTTGLDPIAANLINDLIIKVSRDLGATTVSITHDLQSASKIADDVALIHGGKIIWLGLASDLKNPKDPYLQQFITGSGIGPMIDRFSEQ